MQKRLSFHPKTVMNYDWYFKDIFNWATKRVFQCGNWMVFIVGFRVNYGTSKGDWYSRAKK